ncbi:hypothetical protein [Mycobacteroides abscessus]|uniref:hypothetical protein n=1 Tax=Mycobacteroides abscessus TaxID=36809 RepID=UPI000C265861|nr:hypothetical protein [Mycobacteroides abscessus]
MISDFEPTYRLSDTLFEQALTIIERSGAPELIDNYYAQTKGPGGRPRRGTAYTIKAVLVCALSLIMTGRTPSMKVILNTIGDLTPPQLAHVGMAGQDTLRIFGARDEQDRERHRFTAWLSQRLQCLDSGLDQPARRITNHAHQQIVAARTDEQRSRNQDATERLRTVINRIVAGSIIDAHPEGAEGDLVADESIFDLASTSTGLGAKPDMNRGACYFGKYYSRARKSSPLRSEERNSTSAFGIGVTTITRIGRGEQLHLVPQVFVGMDIHEPTSGSVNALGVAIDHMKRNGLDTRHVNSRRWPLFTVDMGYSTKVLFSQLMLDNRYRGVFRYPEFWKLTEHTPPRDKTQPLPGPIQHAGAFYCPAAAHLLTGHRPPKTRDLLAANSWETHDRRLLSVLPFLMGTNSRPFLGKPPGRPRLGVTPQQSVKAELVCPAVQRRVRCPLKPESMENTTFGLPLAEPAWKAHERTCCSQSSITINLSDEQFRKSQWGPVPGTWEHTLYFEAARSLTEQRFSMLKSPYITGLGAFNFGPRREPMVKILLALAVAATNHRIQKTHASRALREESIDIRWRQLRSRLGYEPARTPPRT